MRLAPRARTGVPMQEGCQTAEFRFYEELNDVLPAERRKRSFAYAFLGSDQAI